MTINTKSGGHFKKIIEQIGDDSMTTHILISVYPRIMRLLESGIKNFEFRPFVINDDEIVMWIYETKPKMMLTAKMTVQNPVSDLPFGAHYGLGDHEFFQIINTGRVAYKVIELKKIDSPISIKELKTIYNLGNAPQNFVYLSNYPRLLECLLNRKSYRQTSLYFKDGPVL